MNEGAKGEYPQPPANVEEFFDRKFTGIFFIEDLLNLDEKDKNVLFELLGIESGFPDPLREKSSIVLRLSAYLKRRRLVTEYEQFPFVHNNINSRAYRKRSPDTAPINKKELLELISQKFPNLIQKQQQTAAPEKQTPNPSAEFNFRLIKHNDKERQKFLEFLQTTFPKGTWFTVAELVEKFSRQEQKRFSSKKNQTMLRNFLLHLRESGFLTLRYTQGVVEFSVF